MSESPLQRTVSANGLDLCVFEWAGADRRDPPLLFAHATGFHARVWDQVIAHLPDHHAYAVDMRGHGRSSKPVSPEAYRWSLAGEDIAALAIALGLNGVIGIGHSWGGFAMAYAAAHTATSHPGLFSRLILLDPVILHEPAYELGVLPIEHFASKRRAQWNSPQEMIDRFKDRPPFQTWTAESLRDYCEYGLLPLDDSEGFTLACPPSVESSIYPRATETNIYPELGKIDIPVLIVRLSERMAFAPTDFQGTPTNPELVRWLKQGRDMQLKGLTHFAPMEDPAGIAGIIHDFISNKGQ